MVQIVHVSRSHAVARAQGVVVRLLDGHESVHADVDELRTLLDCELQARGRAGYLQVIYEGTPPVSNAVRRDGAELFDAYGDRVATVLVLSGAGLWTSTLRIGLRAYTSLLQRSRISIESSLERGVFRLARELGGVDPEELCASCVELRANMRRC